MASPFTPASIPAVASGGVSSYATTLPASPANGDLAVLVDSTTAPTYQWLFRYNSGEATYKWEFLGGAPKSVLIAAGEGTTSATYVDLATAGPSFTLPYGGDYDTAFGCDSYANSIGAYLHYAIKRGAAATSDNDSVSNTAPSISASSISTGRQLTLLGMAAADVVLVQYKSDGASTGSFRYRYLTVLPRRVTT